MLNFNYTCDGCGKEGNQAQAKKWIDGTISRANYFPNDRYHACCAECIIPALTNFLTRMGREASVRNAKRMRANSKRKA